MPPVYEPLLRSCELLFAIAEKKDIPDSEKKVIDSILHDDPVFLSYELDKKFSYYKTSSIEGISEDSLTYSGILADQKLVIPVVLAPTGTKITADIVTGGETIHLEDWSVSEVDRNKSNDIADFEAVYTCKAPKVIVFKEGDTVTLQIIPPGAGADEDPIVVKLIVDKVNVKGVHFKQVS